MSITAILYFLTLDNSQCSILLWFAQAPHLLVTLITPATARPTFTAISDQQAQVLAQAPGLAGFQATDQNGFAAYSPIAAAMVSHVPSTGARA